MDDLFDYAASQERKTAGMDLAAEHAETDLGFAREIARRLAEQDPNRETHADAVGAALDAYGIATGPWAGSIFKGDQWQFTGRRIMSARVRNHGREIKVWRLK